MWWRFFEAIRTGEHWLAPMTWITAVGAVIYAISPIDIIPELFFGPIGVVDDVGVFGILFTLVAREKARWEAGLGRGSFDGSGAEA